MRRTVRDTCRDHFKVLLVMSMAVFVMRSPIGGGRLRSWILLEAVSNPAFVTKRNDRIRFARTLALALTVAALSAGSGCSGRGEATGDTADPSALRIAVLAPAAAEMLEALGLGESSVATGSRGPWPGDLRGLPEVGRFDRPNLERIVELAVTHVVTTRSASAAPSIARLRDRGIEVVELDTETFDGIFASIVELGERFGRSDSAAEVVARIRSDLLVIRRCTESLPRPGTVFVVGHDPLFVAGPGSHLDALLDHAGSVNLFGDEGAAYRQVSMEAVLERQPEVLIEFRIAGAPDPAERWARWEFLPAVRTGRIHGIDPEVIAVPGVRLPAMAAALASTIHPVALTQTDAGSWRCSPR